MAEPGKYDNEEIKKKFMPDDKIGRIRWIERLLRSGGNLESPVDINLATALPIILPPLEWFHLDLPCKKMKLSNTGNTVLLSATWHNDKPFLSGGPFLDEYVFSQLHFHWGRNDMEGSEHTIDGSQYPMELHVVYYNKCYDTHEKAIKQKDGAAAVAYFFKLQTRPNPAVQVLIDYFTLLQKPKTAVRIENLPLIFLLRKFEDDYFFYWGSIRTREINHIVMWLICREPLGISIDQVETFRTFLNYNEEPLLQNFRPTQPLGKRYIFHISPGASKYATLLPISEEQNNFQQFYKFDKKSKTEETK